MSIFASRPIQIRKRKTILNPTISLVMLHWWDCCCSISCICHIPIIHLKLYEMDKDITFSVTSVLSFVVSTSTGRERGSGGSAAALPCLWGGQDKVCPALLCHLENVTPQGRLSLFKPVYRKPWQHWNITGYVSQPKYEDNDNKNVLYFYLMPLWLS